MNLNKRSVVHKTDTLTTELWRHSTNQLIQTIQQNIKSPSCDLVSFKIINLVVRSCLNLFIFSVLDLHLISFQVHVHILVVTCFAISNEFLFFEDFFKWKTVLVISFSIYNCWPTYIPMREIFMRFVRVLSSTNQSLT